SGVIRARTARSSATPPATMIEAINARATASSRQLSCHRLPHGRGLPRASMTGIRQARQTKAPSSCGGATTSVFDSLHIPRYAVDVTVRAPDVAASADVLAQCMDHTDLKAPRNARLRNEA